MKKIALILLFAAQAHAQPLVEHNSNRAVSLDGQTLQVVNVWATWCAPCRREMPALDRWQRRHARRLGAQLIGISLDDATKTQQFLQQQKVSYPIWRYTGNDSTAWMKTLGNTVGALPFTVVRRNGCSHQKTFMGEITEAQLQQAVAQVARQCPAPRG